MRLGKFELHEVLGKGGFGTVYRATDLTLEREVAVKVLHPQLTVDSDFVERFQREARLMAKLEHPNIVPVYELGDIDGRFVIVMRLVKGGSLADLVKQGALPYGRAMEILKDVCAGLQAAHARGWVHRDLKPGNILLDEDGRALLSDFGLARSAQVSSSASSSLGGIGTPFYRAPELWRGKPPATPATDVYALGCILYEMLTGQVLFKGDTPDEVITRHLVNRPQFAPGWPPAGAPASLAKVVAKALARDPAKRYPDASTFWTALQVIDIGQPHQAAGEETVPAARRVPTSVLVLIGFFFLAGILTIAILLGKMVFNFPAAAPAPTSTLAAISTQTAQASETRSISPVPTITMVPSKTPSPTALNYFNHFQVISDTPGELVFSVDYQYSGEFNVITITAGCFHNGEDPGCIETGSADYGPIQGPSSGTLVFHLGIYGTNPSPMITEQIYLGIEPWGTGYRIATQVFDYRKQWTTLLPTPTSVIP